MTLLDPKQSHLKAIAIRALAASLPPAPTAATAAPAAALSSAASAAAASAAPAAAPLAGVNAAEQGVRGSSKEQEAAAALRLLAALEGGSSADVSFLSADQLLQLLEVLPTDEARSPAISP